MKWLEYLQDKYNTYRGGLGLVSGKKYINYSTRYFKGGKGGGGGGEEKMQIFFYYIEKVPEECYICIERCLLAKNGQ